MWVKPIPKNHQVLCEIRKKVHRLLISLVLIKEVILILKMLVVIFFADSKLNLNQYIGSTINIKKQDLMVGLAEMVFLDQENQNLSNY